MREAKERDESKDGENWQMGNGGAHGGEGKGIDGFENEERRKSEEGGDERQRKRV